MASTVRLSIDGVEQVLTGKEIAFTVVPSKPPSSFDAAEPFGIDIDTDRDKIEVSTLKPDNLKRRMHSTTELDYGDFLEKMHLPEPDDEEVDEDDEIELDEEEDWDEDDEEDEEDEAEEDE